MGIGGPSNPDAEVHNQGQATLGETVTQNDRSWIKLLGFFALTTLASSLVIAGMLAGVTVAIAGDASQILDDQQVDPTVPGQTFSGTITDAHCGPRHADSKLGASECARMCVRNGSRYIFVEGGRKYEIAGNSWRWGRLAGKRVSLIGVLNGDSIKVGSARLQAGDGHLQSVAPEPTISVP
jgi:hypothetical protein